MFTVDFMFNHWTRWSVGRIMDAGSIPGEFDKNFVILLKNVEYSLNWQWYIRLKDALVCR